MNAYRLKYLFLKSELKNKMIIGHVLFFLNRENSKGKELKEMLHFFV